MSLLDQLTLGSIIHNGIPARARDASASVPVEVARARTLYRATLTADLLERREVGEMASWGSSGGIRVVPGTGPGDDLLPADSAFDFETFEDAAGFLRHEFVPRLMDAVLDNVVHVERREDQIRPQFPSVANEVSERVWGQAAE